MSQLLMRRPTLDDLPPLGLVPEGYALRTYEPADEQTLRQLMELSFVNAEWPAERLRREITQSERVGPTYLVVHGATAVATASPMLPGPGEGRSGYVHYVGTHPAHRGKGLGRLVTLRVLQRLAELDLHDAFLLTDDWRLPALRLYLRLGFIPQYRDDTHEGRWSRIFPQLLP
jgi:mycothiol synthase